MDVKIYIRNHPDEIPQPWWDRFESTLVPRYVGTDALQKHIEDRRAKLDAQGATLKWEEETGLPYLKFDDEKDAVMFLLKWS